MDPNNLPKFVYLHKDHKFRLKLGFFAAPSNSKIFSKAIRDELQKLKFTYCSDLNGLVMGFGKISSNEVIQADIRHCISVAVNVDVFIFRPPVGSTIEAVVNQTSDNHISCLVHNLFNVSIMRPENQSFNNWSGSKIKKDDKINVKVLSFDHTKKLPHITGDIVDNNDSEWNNFKNKEHHSSIKSLNDKGSNNMKQIEKRDPDCSSSDSEPSKEIKHTAFSISNDAFIKPSSLYRSTHKDSKCEQDCFPIKFLNENNINHINKQIEKKDSASSSSDSESSNEIKRTTYSKTHEVFTKTSSLFKNSRDEQDVSAIKSVNDNNTHNVMNPIEKKDIDSSSSDSASSNEIKHTDFSKSNDDITKTSPLYQGTHKDFKYKKNISTIKYVNDNIKNVKQQIEKEDSVSSSSDSESSNEIKHTTFSKTHNIISKTPSSIKNSRDEQDISPVKSVNNNNTKNEMKPMEKKDSASSSSDSESSNEIKHTTFSKTHNIFSKTPSSIKNSRDEQDISPVKSVNNNNTKSEMKPIEKKDTDSSSSDSEYSNEIKHTTFSKTHNIVSKTPTSIKNSRDEQDISPVKSVNNNNTKNEMKPMEKKDTDSSSSDSESSNEIKHTTFSKTHYIFSKTPSSIKNSRDEQDISPVKSVNDNNTKNVMKPMEKKDTDSSSSDSEFSNSTKHTTLSKTHDGFTTSSLFQSKVRESKDKQNTSSMKYLSSIESINEENTKNDLNQMDNDDSSSDSESSNEKKSIYNLNNRKHINGPLFSSTPNSEHTVNNIGLGRNKLQEQLRKHLAKNKIAKQKSFDSIKSPSKLVKDNYSQYNTATDLKTINNKSNIPATLDDNQNIDNIDKIKLQNNIQSDSGFNGNKLRQEKFSNDNSIKSSSIKSKISIKKNQNSNMLVGTILNYFSPDKDNCTSNVTKNNLSIDCNADNVKNNEIKNTMHNQEKHDLINTGNTDPDKLNYVKSPCKPIDKFLSDIKLSTKNVKTPKNVRTPKNVKTPKNKDIIIDSKIKTENKSLHNQSNIKLSLISDSECSNSDIEDDVRSIIYVGNETNCKKQIQNKIDNIPVLTKNNRSNQYASSSDDEIYTKLQQNISKIEDKTITPEQIKNQPFHEMYSSDDTSVSSSKSLQSTTTKIKSINKFEADKYNIINDKFLNKNSLKEQCKIIQVNEESKILQSPKCSNDKSKLLSSIMNCENNSKIDLIKKILEQDSSSDNEISSKPTQSNISNKSEIVNKNYANQMPTSSALKLKDNSKTVLNENIVNPFIKFYTKNTSSSSEEDGSIIKSKKSTKKSNSLKKKIVSSVKKEENHKNVLINQLLSSMKHKEKKPKKKLLTEQINCNTSKKCIKTPKIKESKEDELKVKTKSKKDVLKKLTIPIKESKSNKLPLDNKPNNDKLISKLHNSSNDYNDGEANLIKKMIKNRKLKIKNDRSESIFSNNVLKKPDKINATLEKTNKSLKSCKTPPILTNELISNNTKLKKKRPIESKDLILNSILNSLESSSDIHPPTKKKKKNEIIKLTDEKNLSKSKKKKKDNNLVIEINDEFEENNSGQHLSMSKKKRKNHSLNTETNNESKDKTSDQSVSKSKKKKKNQNLVIETIDELIDKNVFESKKKKKKKTKNSNCDITVIDNKNQCYDSSVISHKELIREKNLPIDVTKKKKKKKEVKKDLILSDTQASTITDILSKFVVELEDQNLNTKKEKKKKKKKNNDVNS